MDPELLLSALDRAAERLSASQPVVELAQLFERLAQAPHDDSVHADLDAVEEQLSAAGDWEKLVDLYLARVAASTDAQSRAAHLASLSDLLEIEVGDPDRALSALLAGFREAPAAELVADLIRLTRATGRWDDTARGLSESVICAPDNQRLPLLRALREIYTNHLDDPEAQTACLEQLRTAAPPDPNLLWTLARHYAEADRRRDRIGVLAELTDLVSDLGERAMLYHEMAEEWERIGEPDRAAECFEWVLACDANDQDAYRALQRIYLGLKRWRAAIDAYTRHADIVSPQERATLYAQVGRIYEMKLGDCSRALDYFTMADEEAPLRHDVLAALARLHVDCERFDDAVDVLQRCARMATNAEERAALLHNAAEIADRELGDHDLALEFLERSHEQSPDRSSGIEALAALYRDRGEPHRAAELFETSAERAAEPSERARFLVAAANCWASADDDERAVILCRAALDVDPGYEPALEAMARLLWRRRDLDALVPMLARLASRQADPETRHARLRRLARAAAEAGAFAAERDALEQILERHPDDLEARLELGGLCFADGDWEVARTLIGGALEVHEDQMSSTAVIEAHYRVGRCCAALGDAAAARVHIDTALALDPAHREALLARAELDVNEPNALIADKLALVASAPLGERAALLTEIGDLYAGHLGDPVSAREMYREALTYRPTDHVLLNKCLGLIAEQGDWAESTDMLERLIETEKDPSVRAKYRHVAATIYRDELHRVDDAIAQLETAVEEDPTLSCAAHELETLLAERGDSAELASLYYTRLQALRGLPGFAEECLRMWGEIADVYLALGQREEALCALEVATSLEPENARRRQRLAKLYVELGPDHYEKAIEQHQKLLHDNARRVASYHSLCGLYRLTGQLEKERACADALSIIGMRSVDQGASIVSDETTPFRADGPVLDRKVWAKLSNGHVDRTLSLLFSIASPLFARGRARTRQQHGLRRKNRVGAADSRRFAVVLRAVGRRLGIDLPEVYVRREQPGACVVLPCATAAGVSLVLSLGRPIIDDDMSDAELAFSFARCLCDLRADRAARLVFRGAAELAQVIEAAIGIAARNEPGIDHPASKSATSRSLEHALAPLELDQIATIGSRIHERGLDAQAAAQAWLDATDRASARIALALTGDLHACVRALVKDPAASDARESLILDLVRTNVSEEMFEVRSQLGRRTRARAPSPRRIARP